MKRQFDAKLWETGNATVVTIPSSIVKKLKLKKGEIVLITLEKDDEKKTN
jgi:antitoxin component of MazEF toxin-antitoxin module